MEKISKWFNKWGLVIALTVLGVMLLSALGACIYTAIINPFVGIVGCGGVIVALGVLVYLIWEEFDDAAHFGDY